MRSEKRHLDPGAYIGHEPELEEESIPGGVKPGDERVAAYGSQPGVEGEPDSSSNDERDSNHVVESPTPSPAPSEG
jgi:hypothetical protein